jgi:hypothetical protein
MSSARCRWTGSGLRRDRSCDARLDGRRFGIGFGRGRPLAETIDREAEEFEQKKSAPRFRSAGSLHAF